MSYLCQLSGEWCLVCGVTMLVGHPGEQGHLKCFLWWHTHTTVSSSPFPILHRCTAPGAGWPADPSRWPDAKNAPDLDLLWSSGPPLLFRGSSKGHIWVDMQRSVKRTCVRVCLGLGWVDLTLGWHSDQSCTSSGAGPSSSIGGFWSSGCYLRCTEMVFHL